MQYFMVYLFCNVGLCHSGWISSSQLGQDKRRIRRSPDEEGPFIQRSKRSIPSDDMAKLVVDTHNEMRASIGEEHDEPVPADMLYMTWDPGLAYTSLWYAKKCIFEHSLEEERRTKYFQGYNGENLWAGEGSYQTNFDPVVGITSWFEEYKDYDFETQYCEPDKMCGHYTQVVWAQSYKIGCAWTICEEFDTTFGSIWKNAAYMVCQYAPGGNLNGLKLYKVGPRCSQCPANDTCPDGKLCYNEERDAILPGPVDSGEVIAWTIVVLILLSGIGIGGYYFYKHRELLLLTWRKKRKISHQEQTNGDDDSHKNGATTTETNEET